MSIQADTHINIYIYMINSNKESFRKSLCKGWDKIWWYDKKKTIEKIKLAYFSMKTDSSKMKFDFKRTKLHVTNIRESSVCVSYWIFKKSVLLVTCKLLFVKENLISKEANLIMQHINFSHCVLPYYIYTHIHINTNTIHT